VPHEPSGDAADRRPDDRAAEDAAWRAIVDNYGERAFLDDERADDAPADHPGDERDAGGPPQVAAVPEPEVTAPSVDRSSEEHYVPPPPPPVPRAEPARMVAWFGLFGVPAITLAALVTRLPIASWLGLILMVWFVGGFVFLVASMRPGPRDEDDDGAVV